MQPIVSIDPMTS